MKGGRSEKGMWGRWGKKGYKRMVKSGGRLGEEGPCFPLGIADQGIYLRFHSSLNWP